MKSAKKINMFSQPNQDLFVYAKYQYPDFY
jgi:hypothetical protein